jgi:nucleoid-associated protein EbfC
VKGGLGDLLKKAQRMQEDMKLAQDRLAQEEVVGEAGGGMVKITMNGRHEFKRVEIDPTLLGEDKDMLEDLIVAAANAAVARVGEKTKESMESLAAGLPLPPGFKLPF